MKYLRKIGLIIITLITISSCKDTESKYCSKNCQGSVSEENVTVDNGSVKNAKVNNIDNENLGINSDIDKSLVCLLTGAEQVKRKQILQKEIFSQVKKVKEIEDGYIFYFKYEEEFLMRMTDYVIAENNCCPFFTFETKLHSKNDVGLKITGSSEAKEMIKITIIDNK